MGKVVIFDFDGTIADSFVLAVDIFYRLRPRWPILPKGEVERLRGMALLEVVRELHIPFWQLPFLLFRGRRMMAKRLGEVLLIPEMDETIRTLHQKGYKLYVISSNSRTNVTAFLERYDLCEYFSDVKGSAALFGKTPLIKKLASQSRAEKQAVFYVGDEARDIHAAQRAHVHSIAVSWGYNNIHVLNAAKPDSLVFDPADIVKVVEK
jgi:phosphoglycolate phosphatase-like HAD superfamily hydrolase